MKRKQEPNKLYYNVNISYDPFSLGVNKFTTKAETSIELMEPLIENPGDYNLSISKFRIDTEAIPIMIAESAQPNTKDDVLGGHYKTNYHIKFFMCIYDKENDPGKKKPIWMSGSAYVRLLRLFSINDADYLKTDNKQYYFNNLSKDFYIYDYYTFINGVNEALHNAFLKMIENNPNRLKDLENKTKRGYFDIEDGSLFIINII